MSVEFSDVDLLRARVRELTELARAEDLGPRGDITSDLMLPPAGETVYKLVARQAGVMAGCLIAGDVLEMYDRRMETTWFEGLTDGSKFRRGDELARIAGPTRSLLAVERVLLNFLQRLVGIATTTRAFVDAVASTEARIYDTRKTAPGWRVLEKYAVCCGGGRNHRQGLHDAILIKDNHLADIDPKRLAASLSSALTEAAALDPPPTFVQVEADTLEQAEQVFQVVGVDLVLLDNFTNSRLRQTVRVRDLLGLRGKVKLEASGGITLEGVRRIADTGVDRISVGAITHSAPAVDLALEPL
ncbi:MAG: carboxylating nicotinate-nucleotide diphosphorylase [bacterium]|nr:carboxylating nicotinate-nucleotide diphosphorylase [bacterium]